VGLPFSATGSRGYTLPLTQYSDAVAVTQNSFLLVVVGVWVVGGGGGGGGGGGRAAAAMVVFVVSLYSGKGFSILFRMRSSNWPTRMIR
jgi:hypothetical protein